VPSARQIGWIYKPALFLLCLLPLFVLTGRGLGVAGSSLGANPIEAILHFLGKWGLNFLVLTLAISPLRSLSGKNWLITFRRMLGLYAFFYICLHFLTWLVIDQGFYLPGILKDIAKRPFITIGFTALLLLIPLAVTSTTGMVRRLGPRWQQLHRLVYVIVLLGAWHYYWQVKRDVREPLIYIGIIALLLGWRVWKARLRKNKLTAATR